MDSRTINKEKIIKMLEDISNKPYHKEIYSREDVTKMLRNISLEDTYNSEQVCDFISIANAFYMIGLDMGMSPFIARAALHELLDMAFMI